ncbi:hypothetical protein HF086_012730 [Spodoptera exigua]|uniref:Integrin beta epidermal growth factor-like domain-containing protein n=1 Tax=Spodoptera exigua TaxID=7107 RepID=A0A922MUT0_SPOEX|nr:hypothetical protein HF086_012730 [Spodoptera exigua]
MHISSIYLFCFSVVVVVSARNAFLMDDRFVCTVKKSCLECLKLPQCSWCPTENKCFSKTLTESLDYCANDTIPHVDYGLSFEENAECSCNKGDVGRSCYPPGTTEGPECSGRGTCVCGQCVCNPQPDPQYPTKMVMGEYCEYDNFSCDGPKCNEGPYSLTNPDVVDDQTKTAAVDIPPS